jgi:prepilin-type processing-associated H-X9-DG protein
LFSFKGVEVRKKTLNCRFENSNRSLRQGLTLVETIVVLSIGIALVSLLMVAVQQVRATTRRIGCTNNLKQIGVALANYESTYRCLPAAVTMPSSASPFLVLLPYLEMKDLYEKFDLSMSWDGPDSIDFNPARQQRIPLFRCPASPNQELTRTDYVLNRGTTVAPQRNDPWFFFEQSYPKLSQFSKGATGTALMSEFCSFVPEAKKGGYIELPPRAIVNDSQSSDLANECIESAAEDLINKFNGKNWWGGGACNYYHILPPNHNSCFNGNLQFSIDTANSMHSKGVNTLFADGRVKFVSDQIDLDVWKSFGTR